MNPDHQAACNIVRKLFSHINLCLQSDRSKVKLNMLEKGVIKGMLSDKTLNGINNYINNMSDADIKNLMDDLQTEFSRRNKSVNSTLNSSTVSLPRLLHMK